MWPRVRVHLPPAPARVVELGAGALGGFVPFLRSAGYEAIGVDPEAPLGAHFHRSRFEEVELPHQFEAAIACTSLHHVDAPDDVVDRLAGALTNGGSLVVVEWAWERFDEATAEWCFARLDNQSADEWLHRHRHTWLASGRQWATHLREWATSEGLHRSDTLIQVLEKHFMPLHCARGPYFFRSLGDTTEADEQAAIDAGLIQATRVDWAGTPRRPPPKT
jgi:SAM-dependent methyltransferase